MLVAGEDAERAVEWMNATASTTKLLGPKLGSASSVKMLRSTADQGVEALGVEALVTAKRQGILEEVLACLSDADQMPFRDFIAMLVQTHIVHAHRRWRRWASCAQTLRETERRSC